MKEPLLKTIEWNGKPISKSGMYSRIPLEKYHSQLCVGASVSSSGLRKCFSRSPAHFYAEWTGNGDRIEPEEKQHLVLGRAVHHSVLGELFFNKLFAVHPAEYVNNDGEVKPWNYNANYCKEWRRARWSEGRAVLTPDDAINIVGMTESLSRHPIICPENGDDGALNGLIERSLFYIDKLTGLWVKVRPDAIPTSSGDMVDLKTTRSVEWIDLQRTIFDYGYHQQAALARIATRAVLGIETFTFTLVFVESRAPYCVRIVTLKDADLDLGDRQNRYALDVIARCLDSGHWPGPGGEREDAVGIDLPDWARNRINDRLEYGLST